MVYFHIAVNKSKQDIQPHIILQEKEVGASAWFDRNLVELACGQRNGYICDKDVVNNKLETKCQVPKTFTIFTFLTKPDEESSTCKEIEWPLKQYKVYFKNKIMGIMVTLCFGVNCHLILHHNLIHRLNHHHNLYS